MCCKSLKSTSSSPLIPEGIPTAQHPSLAPPVPPSIQMVESPKRTPAAYSISICLICFSCVVPDSRQVDGDDVDGSEAGDEGNSEDPLPPPPPSPQPRPPQPPPAGGPGGDHDGAAPKRRKVRAGWERLEVWKDDQFMGELVWNDAMTSLNAHCPNAAHCTQGHCHTDRSLTDGRKAGQGRPLGFLLAWLFEHAACATKDLHQDLKKSLGQAFGLQKRRDARDWARAQGGAYDELFGKERPRRDGEPDEPDSIA